jgi:2,4-dienoyl-CoA reductase-like NADH-dependent reductase (Old Yellow Enzyme family)
MKSLFDETHLAGLNLKNRFIRSATHDALADERGHMTPALFQIYEDLARGGVGTIITGFTFIIDFGQPNPHQMGIYDDSFLDEYQKLTEMVHHYQANIILQIACEGSQNCKADQLTIHGSTGVRVNSFCPGSERRRTGWV